MDSTRLAQIRYEFYLNIRRRVESIIGQENRMLKNYRESYERELAKANWQIIDKRHFFARLNQAEIVVVGDFHAHKQSTRGFLRIIRRMKCDFVLCLECLRAVDQDGIDAYISGEITEKEFLSRVAWKKNWGFSWENYKPLFKWAQQNKIKIYGINSDSKTITLRQRDEFSAKRIKEIAIENKGSKLFVQFGDLHLASSHLPKAIRKNLPKVNLCTVYQSPEEIYFKVMGQHQEAHADVIKISTDIWSLNVLPPWIKWQDYLLHLESGQDRRTPAGEHDPTDSVSHTVNFLSQLFGLKANLDSLSVYSSSDDLFFDKVETLPISIRKRVIENVQEGLSFWVPELACGYLARFSVNHVARVAAQFLYWSAGCFGKTILDPKKEFYKLIWLEAVTYFFSKVKNPKKKTDTLQDIRSAIQKEQFDDRGKEALQLALTQKMTELQFLSGGAVKSTADVIFSKYGKKSYTVASQILGGIIGEKLFYAFSKKIIKLPENRSLIFKDLSRNGFVKIYYESMDVIEAWPISFKSKYDKL